VQSFLSTHSVKRVLLVLAEGSPEASFPPSILNPTTVLLKDSVGRKREIVDWNGAAPADEVQFAPRNLPVDASTVTTCRADPTDVPHSTRQTGFGKRGVNSNKKFTRGFAPGFRR
jgi:hypothetical protein